MPSVNETVRDNIDRLIEERGLSFPALSQLMDRSDNTIYRVIDRPKAKRIIRSYADNFSYDRKLPWTH